jgi:chaperonin GroEL
LYDRVDDAVCAVRSALEEGVVPGGGKALYDLSLEIDEESDIDKMAYSILRYAICRPLHQILANADLFYGDVYPDDQVGVGYNLKTGEFGNMIEMGVIDPLKVTRSALENAVSVAVTILSTDAIVTMARSYETSTANV